MVHCVGTVLGITAPENLWSCFLWKFDAASGRGSQCLDEGREKSLSSLRLQRTHAVVRASETRLALELKARFWATRVAYICLNR
jgi:hypothetical protein